MKKVLVSLALAMVVLVALVAQPWIASVVRVEPSPAATTAMEKGEAVPAPLERKVLPAAVPTKPIAVAPPAEAQFDPTAVVISGRLLDEARSPYSGQATVGLDESTGSLFAAIPPAKDGRFRVAISSALTGNLVLHFHGDDAAHVAHAARLLAGRNELGDLVMTRPPLLVSGRIIGPDGRPASAAVVIDGLPFEPSPKYSRLQPAVGADGRFAVHAVPQSPRYRLTVRSQFPTQTIEFLPGANLEVQLSAGASLTATFLHSDAIEVLEVTLLPIGETAVRLGGAVDSDRLRARWHRQGDRLAAQWLRLEPGSYRFIVAYQGIGTLLEFPVTVADPEVKDPRLVDIDLRNRVHAIRVSVTDRDGKALPTMARIYLHGSPVVTAWGAGWVEPGGKTFATFAATAPADVYVLASGYRGRSVRGVTNDLTVALEPVANVTLRCTQLADLPKEITAGLLWLPATPLTGVTPNAAGRRPEPTPVEAALMAPGAIFDSRNGGPPVLPPKLVAGVAALRGESSMPLGLEVLLGNGHGNPLRLAVVPYAIDPSTLVDGETIELSVDDAALQEALQQLGVR